MSEDRVIELLEELVKWTKVTSIPKVKALLEELVKSPEEKIAYSLSNGKRTTREIAVSANAGKDAISKWWRKWTRAGIAEPISAPGGGNRARSVFSLEDFGIESPDIHALPKDKSNVEEENKTNTQIIKDKVQ